jgi:hypothetical protein
MSIRHFVHRLSAAVLLVIVTTGAVPAEPALSGSYKAEGKTAEGLAYGGQVEMVPQGRGIKLAWTLDGGGGYSGRGVQLDNVLGSVYWPETERFNDPGIVIYRIDGGKLQGIWMPHDGPQNLTGREDLVGPSSLEGRFEIILGENPGGRSHYTGHVDIERRGDTYHFHWYSPRDSYLGNGIRIGNIMVVGYALGRAPGTAAYCIHGGDLDGLWAYGADSRLGRETLHRQSESVSPGPSADAGSECLATIAMAGPPKIRD